MQNVTELLEKVIHVEDQILVGLVRTSRTLNVAQRVITAARKELTGEDEQAVLIKLQAIADKGMEIVGVR